MVSKFVRVFTCRVGCSAGNLWVRARDVSKVGPVLSFVCGDTAILLAEQHYQRESGNDDDKTQQKQQHLGYTTAVIRTESAYHHPKETPPFPVEKSSNPYMHAIHLCTPGAPVRFLIRLGCGGIYGVAFLPPPSSKNPDALTLPPPSVRGV